MSEIFLNLTEKQGTEPLLSVWFEKNDWHFGNKLNSTSMNWTVWQAVLVVRWESKKLLFYKGLINLVTFDRDVCEALVLQGSLKTDWTPHPQIICHCLYLSVSWCLVVSVNMQTKAPQFSLLKEQPQTNLFSASLQTNIVDCWAGALSFPQQFVSPFQPLCLKSICFLPHKFPSVSGIDFLDLEIPSREQ